MKQSDSTKTEKLSHMLGEIDEQYIHEAYVIDDKEKFEKLNQKKFKASANKKRIVWRVALIAAIFIITSSMSILAGDDILEFFKIDLNSKDNEGFFLSGTISGSGNGGTQAPVTSRDPDEYLNNSEIVESNIQWSISTDGVMVFTGTGEIPNYPENRTPWFEYADKVKMVIISEGITRVGDFAFDRFVNLESITIPTTLKSFGILTFNFCSRINSVYISDIDAWCRIRFEGNLSNPMSYGTENNTIYLNNEPITEVVVPEDVEYLDHNFNKFSQLEKITLPEGLKRIGDSTFKNCKSLKNIEIPDTVTEIGAYAFAYCDSLESVVIPDSVTLVEMGAFSASGLKTVELSKNMKIIYYATFGLCESLEEIVIPENIEIIERNAFGSCENLEKVTILGDPEIHSGAFSK